MEKEEILKELTTLKLENELLKHHYEEMKKNHKEFSELAISIIRRN